MEETLTEQAPKRDDMRNALDRRLNQTLPSVCFSLSILWIILSLGHYSLMSGPALTAMLTVSVATTALLFVLWLAMRSAGLFADSFAHPIATTIVVSLACNSALHILVTADPKHSTNIGILIVSVGCFFMSIRWFVGTIGFILAAWAMVMSQVANTEAWIHFGFMNIIATALAMLVLRNHVHLVKQTRESMEAQSAQAEELRKLSNTDALTSLPNRRAFNAAIAREWSRAVRMRKPLSVVIMDIDYFKDFNDHYGHIEGDACLTQVAAILGDGIRRASDFLGRYGGEEFVAILPDTTSEEAFAIAEQCRKAIEDERIKHAGVDKDRSPYVTMSFGIACANGADGGTAKELVKQADEALYNAKESGRNRVVAA